MYRPWTLRKFGVEMEARTHTTDGGSVSSSNIKTALRTALRNVPGAHTVNSREAGYYHSDGSTWDVKTDASCGWEIAAPALRMDDMGENAELKAACDALTGLRMVVDRACGTHIHFEVPEYDWQALQRLVILWSRYEPFFYELMPRARRTNVYCGPTHRTSWSGPVSGAWGSAQQACRARTQRDFETYARQMERRGALNLTNWWRHRRIEIRLHSGTLNYTKITRWAMLMMAVLNRPLRRDLPPIEMFDPSSIRQGFTTEYICKALGLLPTRQEPNVPPEAIQLVAWLNARRLQFTPEAANIPAVPPVVTPPSPRQAAATAAVDAALSRRVLLRGFLGQRVGSRSNFGDVRVCVARQGHRFHRYSNDMPGVPEQDGNLYHGCPNEPEPESGLRVCTQHSEDSHNGRAFTAVEGWITAEEPREDVLRRHVGQHTDSEYRIEGHRVCVARPGYLLLDQGGLATYHGCPNEAMTDRIVCAEHYRELSANRAFTRLPGWLPAPATPATIPVGTRVRVMASYERQGYIGLVDRPVDTQMPGEVIVRFRGLVDSYPYRPEQLEVLAPPAYAVGSRVRSIDEFYRDRGVATVFRVIIPLQRLTVDYEVIFEGDDPEDTYTFSEDELESAEPQSPPPAPEPDLTRVIPRQVGESRLMTTEGDPMFIQFGTRVRARRAINYDGITVPRGTLGTVVRSAVHRQVEEEGGVVVAVLWDHRVRTGNSRAFRHRRRDYTIIGMGRREEGV